jgi:hypothetical protein
LLGTTGPDFYSEGALLEYHDYDDANDHHHHNHNRRRRRRPFKG